MCGIAGIIASNFGRQACEDIVQQTLKEIGHRGPDHSGLFSTGGEESRWNIGIGANRLAIIDLAASGNQPMHLDDLTLVYNGEVYNYLEIKDELVAKGHRFQGKSDTEVVLHAFREWGIDCMHKFIGMFAIAIFDKKTNKCYLIRDRVGEKPFYYYGNDNTFIFSSELKGLLIHDFVSRGQNNSMLFNYLIFNSVPSPNTIFCKIKQVSPGEFLTVSFQGERLSIKTKKYWQLPDLIPDHSLSEEKVIKDVESLLFDAIKLRLRADVPTGLFLSGGIDSSLIAALASKLHPKIKTFTIGYRDKKHDESSYAEFVVKHMNVDHTTFYLNETMANIDFKKLAYISDCTANISFIPYDTLVKKTKEHVKVALSGDGGDEFFCGYDRSYNIVAKLFKHRHLLKFLSRCIPFGKKSAILNKILSGSDSLNVLLAQFIIRDSLSNIKGVFGNKETNFKIYRRVNVSDRALSERAQNSFWPLNFYEGGGNFLTDTVLKTTDRASMFHSLEVRPVFTDHRIIEYMASVPERIILKKGISKFILKKILSRYLPEQFVFKRVKKGFSVPLVSDYRAKWQKSIEGAKRTLLNMDSVFFDKAQVESILNAKKDKYNMELQSRLVFLINFMRIWQVN